MALKKGERRREKGEGNIENGTWRRENDEGANRPLSRRRRTGERFYGLEFHSEIFHCIVK